MFQNSSKGWHKNGTFFWCTFLLINRNEMGKLLPNLYHQQKTVLKCYYDQKITFIFSLDFKTLFTKHSPSAILNLNVDKKTVYLSCKFWFNSAPLLHQKGYNDVIHSRVLECSACESALFNMQHGSLAFRLSNPCFA